MPQISLVSVNLCKIHARLLWYHAGARHEILLWGLLNFNISFLEEKNNLFNFLYSFKHNRSRIKALLFLGIGFFANN